MENKLEPLLNSLIEKGWKPFGMGKKRKVFARGDKTVSFSYQDDEGIEFYTYLIRDVVSKESGLWQFVCENEMVKERNTRRENHNINSGAFMIFRKNDYEYRLIESSLKDESELEDFLLSNIVIKDEK